MRVPAVVRSVNAGAAGEVPGLKRPSGIHKRPVDQIEVRDPGPKRGGLGSGVVGDAIISRKQGEGDMEGVRRVAWQSVLLLVGVSAIVSSIGLFGAEALMVGLAGAKGEVARVGTQFLRVMMGGSFTIFLLLHLITIQRALGSSKTPIVLLVAVGTRKLWLWLRLRTVH